MINQYRVFQIKEVHHQHWAKSYAQQVEDGFLIHHQNYQSVYKGKPAPSDTPMTARKRLEEKRPNTFIGRSFGVGDVIVYPKRYGLLCSAKKKQAMQSETMLRMAIFGTP